MNENMGVPASPSRHSAEPEPVPVSALRASTANAGDICIIEHGMMRDRHIVARVVKVGKTMWTVQYWRRAWRGEAGYWDREVRRKVGTYHKLPDGVDPQDASDLVIALGENHMEAERNARKAYHASVAELARTLGQ